MRPFQLITILSLTSAPLLTQGAHTGPGLTKDMLVPIHTHAADGGSAYGTWAAGSDYKASFHNGFTFYPVVGDRPQCRLGLRLRQVTRSGEAIPTPESAIAKQATNRRYEYLRGPITERYDVHPGGVEQSFWIPQPLPGSGNLEISIGIDDSTGLRLDDRGFAHLPIVFRDRNGDSVIEYGRAFAIDADGRKFSLDAAIRDRSILIRVTATTLSEASYPLLVDPLIQNKLLQGAPHITSFGHDNASTNSGSAPAQAFVFSRRASQLDNDCFLIRTAADFSNPKVMWSDISTSWAAAWPEVTYVTKSGSWAIAFRRTFNSGAFGLRAHVQTFNSPTPNSGKTTNLHDLSSSNVVSELSICGTVGATGQNAGQALVSWLQTPTSGPGGPVSGPQEPAASILDTTTNTATPAFPLATNLGQLKFTRMDLDLPDTISAGNPWVFCFVERTWGGFDNYRARVARVMPNGAVSPRFLISPNNPNKSYEQATVAGDDGRYLIALGEMKNYGTFGSEIQKLIRFDWPASASAPTLVNTRNAKFPAPIAHYGQVHEVAFDRSTRSHWAVTFSWISTLGRIMAVHRFGYTGGTVEQANIKTSIGRQVTYPTVCFSRRGSEPGFSIFTFAEEATGDGYYANRLEYRSEAAVSKLGLSCGGSVSTANTPYAGHEFHTVSLNQAAKNKPIVLAIGGASTYLPLWAAGAPGCALYLHPLATLAGSTNGLGRAQMTFALPDEPTLVGTAYTQWGIFDQSANAMGLQTSNALKHVVR